MVIENKAEVDPKSSGACVFCEIIGGKVLASRIMETRRFLVFTSLAGYPLIVPKLHVVDLFDPIFDNVHAQEFGILETYMSRVVKEIFEVSGVSTLTNSGKVAGQEIHHLHKHIMPRRGGDRLIRYSPDQSLSRQELDSWAIKMANKVGQLGQQPLQV